MPMAVSSMSALRKVSVSVTPGTRQVTVTPLSFNSSLRANEKLLLKAALSPASHRVPDLMDQVDCAGDICFNDASSVVKILIQKAVAKPVAGVCHQKINRPACRNDIIQQAIDAGNG